MSLYTIADTHLSLGTDKPMDVFHGWDNYVERLENNWRALVAPEDTVVIAGDISWAMGLSQTAADFAFLDSLPGRKLLFKGNHDYWWTTRRKMDDFLAAQGFSTLRIVHNDAWAVDGFAAAPEDGFTTPKRTPTARFCCGRWGGFAARLTQRSKSAGSRSSSCITLRSWERRNARKS